MGSQMQSFKSHIAENAAADAAKAKLKKMKGKEVSFTHQSSGEKVTGTYQGMKSMGGRSYAHIETGKSAHRVPPHHIHQTQESVVNELSKKTLGAYAKAASNDQADHAQDTGKHYANNANYKGAMSSYEREKRRKGVKMAINKLMK